MPTKEWERGFAAGWRARRDNLLPEDQAMQQKKIKVKKERRASAYNKRYGRAFKKLAPKYKKKNGQWKKDGFKRCGAAARKEAKRS